MPAEPDMSNALSMDAAAPAPDAAGGDMFGGPPAGGADDAMPELGAADETELDPMFAADAQDLFPDFDDKQLTSLQKLIDSRLHAATTPAA